MEIISSIFLDFDNIFGCLSSYGQTQGHGLKVATAFASRPSYWLEALASMRGDEQEDVIHRFVVRRCYLNPTSFAHFRSAFVRDGWEVIDTPPLTSLGKTSADMIMAIDILDTLAQYGHVSEYVILSADADFTPIIIRLRKHLKKTVVYTSVNTAAAYRGACDSIIDEKMFVEIFSDQQKKQAENLTVKPEGSRVFSLRDVEDEIVAALRKEPAAILPIASIGHALRKKFGKEISDTWVGYKELGKLVREIEKVEIESTVKGPAVRLKAEDPAAQKAAPEGPGTPTA